MLRIELVPDSGSNSITEAACDPRVTVTVCGLPAVSVSFHNDSQKLPFDFSIRTELSPVCVPLRP